jgi:predicted transporter
MKGNINVILMGLLFIIVAFVRWNMMRENARKCAKMRENGARGKINENK